MKHLAALAFIYPLLVHAQSNFTALLVSNAPFLRQMKRDEIPSSLSLLVPEETPKYTLGKIKMKAEAKGCNVTVNVTSSDKASLGVLLRHFFPQLNMAEVTGNAVEPKKFNVKSFMVEKCKKTISFDCEATESFDLVKGNMVAKQGKLLLSFAYQGELDALQYLDVVMNGQFSMGDKEMKFEVTSPKETSNFILKFETQEIKFFNLAKVFLKQNPIFPFLKGTKLHPVDKLNLEKVSAEGQYSPAGDLEITVQGTASNIAFLDKKEVKILINKAIHHKTKVMLIAKFVNISPLKVMTDLIGADIKPLTFLSKSLDVVMLELSSDDIYLLSDNDLNKELSQYAYRTGVATKGLAVKFYLQTKEIFENYDGKEKEILVQLTVSNGIMRIKMGDNLETSLSDILGAISKKAKVVVPPNLFGADKGKVKVEEIVVDVAKGFVNVALSFTGKTETIRNILNFNGLKVFAVLKGEEKVWEFGAKSTQTLFGRSVEVQLKLVKGKYYLQANFALLNIKDFNSKLDSDFFEGKEAKKFSYLSNLDLLNAVLLMDLQDPTSFRVKGSLPLFDSDSVELQGKVWIKEEDQDAETDKNKKDDKKKQDQDTKAKNKKDEKEKEDEKKSKDKQKDGKKEGDNKNVEKPVKGKQDKEKKKNERNGNEKKSEEKKEGQKDKEKNNKDTKDNKDKAADRDGNKGQEKDKDNDETKGKKNEKEEDEDMGKKDKKKEHGKKKKNEKTEKENDGKNKKGGAKDSNDNKKNGKDDSSVGSEELTGFEGDNIDGEETSVPKQKQKVGDALYNNNKESETSSGPEKEADSAIDHVGTGGERLVKQDSGSSDSDLEGNGYDKNVADSGKENDPSEATTDRMKGDRVDTKVGTSKQDASEERNVAYENETEQEMTDKETYHDDETQEEDSNSNPVDVYSKRKQSSADTAASDRRKNNSSRGTEGSGEDMSYKESSDASYDGAEENERENATSESSNATSSSFPMDSDNLDSEDNDPVSQEDHPTDITEGEGIPSDNERKVSDDYKPGAFELKTNDIEGGIARAISEDAAKNTETKEQEEKVTNNGQSKENSQADVEKTSSMHPGYDLEAFLDASSNSENTISRDAKPGLSTGAVNGAVNLSEKGGVSLQDISNHPGEVKTIEDDADVRDGVALSSLYKRRLNENPTRLFEKPKFMSPRFSAELLSVLKNSEAVAESVASEREHLVRSNIPTHNPKVMALLMRSTLPTAARSLAGHQFAAARNNETKARMSNIKMKALSDLGRYLPEKMAGPQYPQFIAGSKNINLNNNTTVKPKLKPQASQFPPWEIPQQKPQNNNIGKELRYNSATLLPHTATRTATNFPVVTLTTRDEIPSFLPTVVNMNNRASGWFSRQLRRRIRSVDKKKVTHMTFAIIFKDRALVGVLEKLYGQKMLSQSWINKATIGLVVSSVDVNNIMLQSKLFNERKIEAGLSLLVSFQMNDNCIGNDLCTDISKRFPKEKTFVLSGTPKDKGVTLTTEIKAPMKVAEKIVLTETKFEIESTGLEDSRSCVVGTLQMKKLPLNFSGGISVGDSGLLELNLGMDGTWKQPFKIDQVSVTNLNISQEITPGEILKEIGGNANFVIGNGDNAIKANGRIEIDFLDPKKTFFYAPIPKVDIKQLLKSVGISEKIKVPKYLESIKFPEGLVAAFAASKDGNDIKHLDLKVMQGFALVGKSMIGQQLAACRVTMEEQKLTIDSKFRELTFSKGALLIKSGKEGSPTLRANISKEKFEGSISGVLELLGIKTPGKILFGQQGLQFEAKGKLMGLVQTSLKGTAPSGDISAADFQVQGCLTDGLPKIGEKLGSSLKSWFKKVKALQEKITSAAKGSTIILQRAKGAAVTWQTKTERYDSQLKAVKEHIEEAKSAINKDCIKTCGKVCLGSMEWNKKCFSVFGQWLGCPKWEHCKWRIPNLTCIAKCESDKVAKKLSTGREISRVEILYSMTKEAKKVSSGANSFVQSAADVADTAKALESLSHKAMKPALDLANKMKDIQDGSFKMKFVCLTKKLSEGKSGCFLFNISASIMDDKQHQIGGTGCLGTRFEEDIAEIAAGELFPEIDKAKQSMRTLEMKLFDLGLQEKGLADKELTMSQLYDSQKTPKRSSIETNPEDDWLRLEDVELPQYVIQGEDTKAAFAEMATVFKDSSSNAFQKTIVPEANSKVFMEDVESLPSVCKQRRAVVNQCSQITSGLHKLADNFEQARLLFKKSTLLWTRQQKALESRYNNVRTMYNVTDGRAEDLLYWVNQLKNSTMTWVSNLSMRFYNSNKHLLGLTKRELSNVIQRAKGIGLKEYLKQIESLVTHNYKRANIPSQETGIDDSVTEVAEQLTNLFSDSKKLITDSMEDIREASARILEAKSKLRKCHSD